MLAGAEGAGASWELREVADGRLTDDLHDAIRAADAIVFASPTFRADVAWPMKALLDALPKGDDAKAGPLLRKACATVISGGSDHHFLGGDKVRSVLDSFFGAQLLCPGVYVVPRDFLPDGTLAEPIRSRLFNAGAALVDLATAVNGSQALRAHRPQI